MVERRLLRLHLQSEVGIAEARSECSQHSYIQEANHVLRFQTNQARLMNDLIAGTIGGFVGTALNTP